jgi:hypothetical protein
MMFSARMTLDLVWALSWWTAINQGAFKEFCKELEARRKLNPALDVCAKEAGL